MTGSDGGSGWSGCRDVLDIDPKNAAATIAADLAGGDSVP
jgi:hypothetical protein